MHIQNRWSKRTSLETEGVVLSFGQIYREREASKLTPNNLPLPHDLDGETPGPAPTKLKGVYFVRDLSAVVSVQLTESLT
jgi:hypothetical protein